MLSIKPRWAGILITILLVVAPCVWAETRAITGGTVIDGTGNDPIEDGVVVISDDRIIAVGGGSDMAIPRSATIIDACGKYVIPGLMDANVHLFINLDLETLIKYEDRYHEIIIEGAQIALKHGLTTVFDTWGPRAELVKARDTINAGQAPGSRIYLAGNIIGFDGPFSGDFIGPPPPGNPQQSFRRAHQ
jgi:imidazolonepropionase-like amidohydrolase